MGCKVEVNELNYLTDEEKEITKILAKASATAYQ
ncbi:MAG: hypothetical protein ACJATI_001924 [Halioglobus sp.]|jgi:hypothetical protein